MSLPGWAQATPQRRAHIERVVALLNSWADAMHVAPNERDRWLRAGWLHDALRDAPLADWAAHGPAAADRAAATGERDAKSAPRSTLTSSSFALSSATSTRPWPSAARTRSPTVAAPRRTMIRVESRPPSPAFPKYTTSIPA